MALTDLRIFQWYQKYIVKAADMTNLQLWLRGMFEGTFEGAFGGAILSGCNSSPASGLTVNITAGILVTPSGRIINIPAGFQATYASPSGNPAKSVIVARPKLTDSTLIPEPLNPSNNVYLYKIYDYDIVVLNGSPNSSPVYPALNSDDVVLNAAVLSSGQTNIAATDFDFHKISRPRKTRNRIKKILESYTMDGTERVVEVDFSAASGLLTLPAAADFPGEFFSVVKIDSSSNVCAVTGDMISDVAVELDTQNEVINFYSNGVKYRSL